MPTPILTPESRQRLYSSLAHLMLAHSLLRQLNEQYFELSTLANNDLRIISLSILLLSNDLPALFKHNPVTKNISQICAKTSIFLNKEFEKNTLIKNLLKITFYGAFISGTGYLLYQLINKIREDYQSPEDHYLYQGNNLNNNPF